MWFGVVNKWRGIFLLMDTDSGLGWKSYLLFLAAGLLVLVKLGLLATVVALPLSCDLEPDHTFFDHETPLSTTVSGSDCYSKALALPVWRGSGSDEAGSRLIFG